MSVRCKIICTEVNQDAHSDGTIYREVVKFSAVYSSDPNSENKWFAQWTPYFDLTKVIENPKAFGTFKKGNEYYVDFTEVPKTGPILLTEDFVNRPSTDPACSTCDPVETAADPAPPVASVPAPAPSEPETEETPPPAS